MSRLDSESIHPSFLHKILFEHYAYEALRLFFQTSPGAKCRANGELLKTYSGLSEIFSPFPSHSFWVGEPTEWPSNLSWLKDKQGAVEGEAPAHGGLGGACRGICPSQGCPRPPFSQGWVPCVYTLIGHPQVKWKHLCPPLPWENYSKGGVAY